MGLLQLLTLQFTGVAEMSFDIENILTPPNNKIKAHNPIFITGLARSGTTALMRHFYDIQLFGSLTYLDMPFVLMPNTWKRMVKKKASVEYKERIHDDKIMVGFDSPEALDEIFWRVFSGDKYIGDNLLMLYEPDAEILQKFEIYMSNVMASADTASQTRYLSKNNNNILRYKKLQSSIPDASFIVPFREPLQHALSLLNQHLHFSKIQQEDKFSLDYMNWLGHFEFGLNQKPFLFNDEKLFNKMQNYKKTDINYWLLSWLNYYSYVNSNIAENTIIFHYEAFCKQPSLILSNLFDKLNIMSPPSNPEPFEPENRTIKGFDKGILKECTDIYEQLKLKHSLWVNN